MPPFIPTTRHLIEEDRFSQIRGRKFVVQKEIYLLKEVGSKDAYLDTHRPKKPSTKDISINPSLKIEPFEVYPLKRGTILRVIDVIETNKPLAGKFFNILISPEGPSVPKNLLENSINGVWLGSDTSWKDYKEPFIFDRVYLKEMD